VGLVVDDEWLVILTALDLLLKSRITEAEGRVPTPESRFSPIALAALNEAYAATLRYYLHLREGGGQEARAESVIAGLWWQTGAAILPYDVGLSEQMTRPKAFWLESSTWSPLTNDKAWVLLNSVRISLNTLDTDRKTLWSGNPTHTRSIGQSRSKPRH
jgi:hypothetical protein